MAMSYYTSVAMRDWCAGLATRGIRDEAAGYVAKLRASEALGLTAVNTFRLNGGRSLVVGNELTERLPDILAALVYEGPNEILRDVGGPNAVMRDIRAQYLQPVFIAMDAVMKGDFSKLSTLLVDGTKTALLFGRTFLSPTGGAGFDDYPEELRRYIKAGLGRNRAIGRQYALLLMKHRTGVAELALEVGLLFEKLSFSAAAIVTAVNARQTPSGILVARAAHLDAERKLRGLEPTLQLRRLWAQIGLEVADVDSDLHQDLIGEAEVHPLIFDPRDIDSAFPARIEEATELRA